MGRTCRPLALPPPTTKPAACWRGGMTQNILNFREMMLLKSNLEVMVVNMTLSDTIRQAIADSEDQKTVADNTGINKSVISRFVRGHQGISLSTADKLAAYFGYELKKKKRGSKNGS